MHFSPPDTIIACQHCNEPVYKTKRALKYGESVSQDDVDPIHPQPPLNMEKQECVHCGKEHGLIRLRVPAHLA
jgi:hypothetical protein